MRSLNGFFGAAFWSAPGFPDFLPDADDDERRERAGNRREELITRLSGGKLSYDSAKVGMHNGDLHNAKLRTVSGFCQPPTARYG